ncbi:MAG TPA: hypothetical protein VGN72_24065 [Tepidisphaeraceae bacterium]|nr:hypothetical protein [Tepidisphaeraceae bacterium]
MVVNHDDSAVAVAIRDDAAQATSAGWTWNLFNLTPGIGGADGDGVWTAEEKNFGLGLMKGTSRRKLATLIKTFNTANVIEAQRLSDFVPPAA